MMNVFMYFVFAADRLIIKPQGFRRKGVPTHEFVFMKGLIRIPSLLVVYSG